MRIRFIVAAVVIAVLSSLATWATAQVNRPSRSRAPMIIGSDIAFRLEKVDRNIAWGQLLVRVDGQWVEADFSTRVTQLSKP